jgi:Tol biopolymer transport system component
MAAGLLAMACGGSGGRRERTGIPVGVLAYQGIEGQSYSLRLVKADGTGDEALPGLAAASAFTPSFSLASGQIAFKGYRQGAAVLVLHAWRDDAERVLDVGALQPAGPALSPDGATVAFEGSAGTGRPDVYLMATAGGTPVAVAQDPDSDAGPAWAPDGRSLYFGSIRTGQWEIFKVDADGANLIQVTTGSKLLGRVAVSPDGLSIAYAKAAGAQGSEVVVRTLADGTERVLFDAASESEPDYDATGKYLAVVTTLYGPPAIIVRDVATGDLVRRLTDRPGLQSAPAFAR